MATSADIPDTLYDKDGNSYVVVKPFTPDSDCWVRVIPACSASARLPTPPTPIPTSEYRTNREE